MRYHEGTFSLPPLCNWLQVVGEGGAPGMLKGDGGGRCWRKGKARRGGNPRSPGKCIFTACPPLLGFKVTVSWARDCGAPAGQKSRPVPPVFGVELGVLQVLESPEDTGTAATAGVGRRRHAGRRPRPGLSRKLPLDVASGSFFSLRLCSPTRAGGADLPGGPGWGPGRRHVTGTPGSHSLAHSSL